MVIFESSGVGVPRWLHRRRSTCEAPGAYVAGAAVDNDVMVKVGRRFALPRDLTLYYVQRRA